MERADVVMALHGAHAGWGPTAEQVCAVERARDEEAAARRLAALDEFLAEYEAVHGEITADEMEQAVQRLRARGRGKRPDR